MFDHIKFIALVSITLLSLNNAYKIPPLKLELLDDGFRVSIPDTPGVRNVAFNVNRNHPFQLFEPGEFSIQLHTPIDGRWLFDIKRILQDSDIIYIWINVQHELLRYQNVENPISIKDLRQNINNNNNNYNDDFITLTTEVIQTSSEKVFRETTGPITNTMNNISDNDCIPSITIVQNHEVCKGELIFVENFNEMNTTRWFSEVRFPLDDQDAEFVVYDYIAKVRDNLLSIIPKLWNNNRPGTDIRRGEVNLGSRCTGTQDRTHECIRKPLGLVYLLPPVITARINTKNSFSFKYGIVEIRAKLPKGDWIVPLLALDPLRKRYGSKSYASGQLRIAFARGNSYLINDNGTVIDGRRLYSGAILTTNATLRETSMVNTIRNSHFGDDFHVYKMVWTKTELTFYVDNELYGVVNGNIYQNYPSEMALLNGWQSGDFMAPFDEEFYITIGLSAGGHTDFPDNSLSGNYRKPWLNTSPQGTYRFWQHRGEWKPTWTDPELQVDYIKVWAL